MSEALPSTPDLQAVAFHLFSRCADQRTAFDECMDKASKSKECESEFKDLTACAKGLVADAAAKAAHQFKEYAHCLDLTRGHYNYCRPEKAKFEAAFPLEG